MGEPELAHFIDRFTVEYVRVYAHPIERVWRAISDPQEFRFWFIPGRLEARQGGEYWFGDDGFQGIVEAVEPPRFIRFGTSTGYFQYELTGLSGGTRMRFLQHFTPGDAFTADRLDLGGDLPGGPDTPWKPGFVGGWHEYWDALSDYLDGIEVGSRLPPTGFNTLAALWTEKMERAGVFTPAQAKRAALSLRRHERWNDLNQLYREHIRATLPAATEIPRET